MNYFTVSLANVPIGIDAMYPSTKRFCAKFLTNQTPHFSITMRQPMIENERVRAQKKGADGCAFSDAYLETIALYRALAAPLLAYDAVIFHGAVAAVDGEAFLFTAPPGTGKTTHMRLWLSQIPNAHVLNGDKPLLRLQNGVVYACGTPWQGKENYGCNEILPLRAICFLHRAPENRIESVSAQAAFSALLQQVYCPEQPDGLVQTLRVLDEIGKNVNLYRLGCNTQPQAAWVSYRGMCHDL